MNFVVSDSLLSFSSRFITRFITKLLSQFIIRFIMRFVNKFINQFMDRCSWFINKFIKRLVYSRTNNVIFNYSRINKTFIKIISQSNHLYRLLFDDGLILVISTFSNLLISSINHNSLIDKNVTWILTVFILWRKKILKEINKIDKIKIMERSRRIFI